MRVRSIDAHFLEQIQNNALRVKKLEIEEELDEQTIEKLALALRNNTTLTELYFTIAEKEPSPSIRDSISHSLQRNQQIAHTFALIILELIQKKPVHLTERQKTLLKDAKKMAKHVLGSKPTHLSSVDLSTILEDITHAFTQSFTSPALTRQRFGIFSESSGELTSVSNTATEGVSKINENDYFLKNIALAQELITLFNSCATTMNLSPLHLLASFNLTHYLILLMNLGASPNTQNDDGETPLHMAAFSGNLEAAQLLIERGANLFALSTKGTALQLAITENHPELAAFLRTQQKNDTSTQKPVSAERVQAGRRLFYVLGGIKLRELAHTEGTLIDAVGGDVMEGYQTLALYMQRFIKDTRPDKQTQNRLHAIIYHLQHITDISEEEIMTNTKSYSTMLDKMLARQEIIEQHKNAMYYKISQGQPGERFIIPLRYLGHVIGCSIDIDKTGRFHLILADRGPFSGEKKSGKKNKYASIQSLTFDPSHLNDLIHLLNEVANQNHDGAKRILFEDIPSLTQSTYVTKDTIFQSTYEVGICYFANPKSILYKEFVEELGPEKGKQLYRDFNSYMSEQVVHDFEQLAGRQDPHAVAGKSIVSTKNENKALRELLKPLHDEKLTSLLLNNLSLLQPLFPKQKNKIALLRFLLENKFSSNKLTLLVRNATTTNALLRKEKMTFYDLLKLETNLRHDLLSNLTEVLLFVERTGAPLKPLLTTWGSLSTTLRPVVLFRLSEAIFIMNKCHLSFKELMTVTPEKKLIQLLNDPFSDKSQDLMSLLEKPQAGPSHRFKG